MTIQDTESSIKSILTRLEAGKKLTLSFPSPRERELFRVALYKAKREVDEVFLMTDESYEVDVLNFQKINDTLDYQNMEFGALISITKKAELSKRGYSFSIIREEDQDNTYDESVIRAREFPDTSGT